MAEELLISRHGEPDVEHLGQRLHGIGGVPVDEPESTYNKSTRLVGFDSPIAGVPYHCGSALAFAGGRVVISVLLRNGATRGSTLTRLTGFLGARDSNRLLLVI